MKPQKEYGALTQDQQAVFDALFESMNHENPNVDTWEDFTVDQAFKAGWDAAVARMAPAFTAEALQAALQKASGRYAQPIEEIRAALSALHGGGK